MKSKSCFIMGLPSAGKTTYLAALWYSINHYKKSVLRLNKFTEDHSYLTRLSTTWLTPKIMTRTSAAEQKSLTLLLEDEGKNLYDVTFPDLSGEIFSKQYLFREMDVEIKKYICNSDGCLFFIGVEDIIEPTLIANMRCTFEQKPEIKDTETKPMQRKPIQDDPTDVKLVELLQFVRFVRDEQFIKLGLVLSAWDLLMKENKTPEEYVKKQFPLLWQYITSNVSQFGVFYYGVSAQGSSLKEATERAKIEKMNAHVERIIVVNNQGHRSSDITLPLWEILKEGDLP